MGTFTHTPAPTAADQLAVAKSCALARLNADYETAARPLIRDYPEAERLGWMQQQSEAIAYRSWVVTGSDSEAPDTSALSAILRGRNGSTGGETLEDLSRAVILRADAMIQWQEFTGIRHRGEWAIQDAETPEAAMAVTWESLVV
ncbi:hypothetical protein [Vreelandella profundi]|uniref:hypothetical protein n=1 Tax=Vreelandella profundi TaxID=2852117 RepID=UPI001F2A3F6B|nr:hypothetical protein [Halomonas profundi]